MAPVYSKIFFDAPVAPGTPQGFMTGGPGETWIIRSVLCTAQSSGFGWSVNIYDGSSNMIWTTGVVGAQTSVVTPFRLVLNPAMNYTVSAGTDTVYVCIDGYVLSN